MAVTRVLRAAAVSAAVAGVATPVAGRVARRLGIVDRPGPLKVHGQEMPYLGGVGVCCGLAAATWSDGGPAAAAMLTPTVLALALGVADDAAGLSPRTRVATGAVIGAAAAAANPTRFPGAVGRVAVGAATVGMINAVNLIDGLDGLAGGVSLASAVGFAGLLDGDARLAASGLAGGLVGFLPHNWPRARIYLGDGGSYATGAALATLLASAWAPQRRPSEGLAGLLMVAGPVTEVAAAVVRRRRSGQPMWVGDRRHSYDLLVSRGWKPPQVSAVCAAAQAGLVATGIIARRGSTRKATVAVGAGLAALVAGMAAIGAFGPGETEQQRSPV